MMCAHLWVGVSLAVAFKLERVPSRARQGCRKETDDFGLCLQGAVPGRGPRVQPAGVRLVRAVVRDAAGGRRHPEGPVGPHPRRCLLALRRYALPCTGLRIGSETEVLCTYYRNIALSA